MIGQRKFIVHYRSIENEQLGNATVVFIPDSNANFNVGVSYCSPRDRWNRKRAIEIASGRATKNLTQKIQATTKEELYKIASDVATEFYCAPRWARKLVEQVQNRFGAK